MILEDNVNGVRVITQQLCHRQGTYYQTWAHGKSNEILAYTSFHSKAEAKAFHAETVNAYRAKAYIRNVLADLSDV